MKIDLAYEARKADFFASEADRVMAAHDEAMACRHIESVVRDLTRAAVLVTDAEVEHEWAVMEDPSLVDHDALWRDAFGHLARANNAALTIVEGFEQKGYDVEGAGELRKVTAVLRAAADPSDGTNPGAGRLAEEAAVDFHAGRTEAWDL